LLTKDGDSVSFAGATDLVFRQLGGKASYLARIHTDGTGLERITETPIVERMGTSPDGAWVVAAGWIDPEKSPRTYAISLRNRSRRILCTGPCPVKWSLDGKFLFVTMARSASDARDAPRGSGQTLVIRIPSGLGGVAIPDGGFRPGLDQEVNGIRVIRQGEVFPGFDANTYAYTSAEFQGNLFRIPLH
jgi:hypothetical protein